MNNDEGRPKCDACGRAIQRDEGFYVSPLSDEWKVEAASIGGIPGVRRIQKNVCIEDFRKDYAIKYPGLPCPV